ncbi:hypothetical protein MUP95_04935 [bacterium]|nr:hypothetical protein [bacterium]
MFFINNTKSKMSKKPINENAIVYKSKIPEYIDSANKIYNKQYDSAIIDLKQQLKKTNPNDFENLSMIHINLMQAYFKNRTKNENYFDLSTFHAKEALKYGHNTGLAAYRLIVNLEKIGEIQHAIEVCKLVISKEYHFSKYGFKQKPEFIERLNKLNLKFKKQVEHTSESYFTEEEKEMIIINSKKNK